MQILATVECIYYVRLISISGVVEPVMENFQLTHTYVLFAANFMEFILEHSTRHKIKLLFALIGVRGVVERVSQGDCFATYYVYLVITKLRAHSRN